MREEPEVSGADGAAPDVVVGVEVPETGDSEDSSPFRVKRSRPVNTESPDVLDDAAPPAGPTSEPPPSTAAPKKPKLGRLSRRRFG